MGDQSSSLYFMRLILLTFFLQLQDGIQDTWECKRVVLSVLYHQGGGCVVRGCSKSKKKYKLMTKREKSVQFVSIQRQIDKICPLNSRFVLPRRPQVL